MPRFEPFVGLRYNAEGGLVDDVVAPPYDVIGPDERAALEARNPFNAVRLELPRGDGDLDPYEAGARRLRRWQDERVLVADPEPSFYVYRMGFRDEHGRPRQTSGVVGALGLPGPAEGDVLPHEQTTAKDKADRLNVLRASRANLSPIWGLSLAEGLSALCEPSGPPVARATDDEGVHHRLYQVTQAGVVEGIAAAVASAPVVVADGHHRLEVALEYRRERDSAGAVDPHADAIMALVVELADEQLSVRAIHRLVSDLPAGFDLVEALAPWFDAFPAAPGDVLDQMTDAGALGLLTARGAWLLRPLPPVLEAATADLDSARWEAAQVALPPGADVRFQHGVDEVTAAVGSGAAQAGVLLRPATVAQIAETAHRRAPMPAKTTFFWPKPRTGLVFRLLD